MITDVLIASPIINSDMEDGAGAGQANVGGAGGAGMPPPSQFADYGGVDPSIDPELAMALRISLEEERARQVQPEEQQQQPSSEHVAQPLAAHPGQAAAVGDADMHEEEVLDEEAILQRALMLSVAEPQPTDKPQDPTIAAAQNKNEFKDFLQDNDFIMSIAKDLGIDNIQNDDEATKKKQEEQKKKEEEDKK